MHWNAVILQFVQFIEYSSSSQLMSPLEDSPLDSPSIEVSCSTMGFLFSRKNCKDSFDDYSKCRKSADVIACSNEGRELALRTLKYSSSVVANCVTAASSLYQARLGADGTDSPPSDMDTLTHFYRCLSGSK